MLLEPVRHVHVPEATIKKILQMIGEGYWKPGDRMLSQRELASSLGIGVSSLREALQSLQAMGILEVRHGGGTYVTAHPNIAIQKLLDLSLSLVELDVRALFDARLILESGLAYFAALRSSPQQTDILFKKLEALRDAIDKDRMDEAGELDLTFHHLIAEMADSEFLKQVEIPLYRALGKLFMDIPHSLPGWEKHFAVAKAIREHNPTESSRAMRNLIEDSAQKYKSHLEQKDKQRIKKMVREI